MKFVDDCVGPKAEAAAADLKPGEVLLLENLRFYKEEKAGDEGFSEQLSKLAGLLCKRCFWNCAQGTCFDYDRS